MRQVTGSMANVVKGMDSAMKSMDLEKVRYQYLKIKEHAEDCIGNGTAWLMLMGRYRP